MNRSKQYIRQEYPSADSTVLVVKILVDLVAVTIDPKQFRLKVDADYNKKDSAA